MKKREEKKKRKKREWDYHLTMLRKEKERCSSTTIENETLKAEKNVF